MINSVFNMLHPNEPMQLYILLGITHQGEGASIQIWVNPLSCNAPQSTLLLLFYSV
jgi:hypothetical protein